MGCGKTLQAVALLQHYRELWPALILVPPNLLEQWEREILGNMEGLLQLSDIKLIRKGSDVVSGKICIVSYTALESLTDNDRLSPDRFGIVIADESHFLKTREAKRTIKALPFLKRISIAICLTGTPSTNRPVELYTQLNGLLPNVFSDYDKFTKRYCDAKPSRFGGGLDVKGSSNERELKLVLNTLVMIRRLKEEVITLPQKKREVIYVQPDHEYFQQLKLCKDQMKNIETSMKNPNIDNAVLRQMKMEQQMNLNNYYSLTGLAKVNQVKNELRRIIDELQVESTKIETSSADARANSNIRSLTSDNDSAVEVIDISNVGKEISPKNLICIQDDNDDDLFSDKVIEIDRYKEIDLSSKSKVPADLVDSDDDLFQCKDKKKKLKRLCKNSSSQNNSSVNIWQGILNGNASNASNANGKNSKKHKTSKKTEVSEPIKSKVSKISMMKKIILFGHHKNVMDALEDCIIEMGLGYVRINGEVAIPLRDDLVHKFHT